MKRWMAIAALLAAACWTGCSPAPTNAPAPVEPETAPASAESASPAAPEPPKDAFSATGGIELAFYDDRPTAGEAPKTFTIAAPNVAFDSKGMASFKKAEAVLYGRDGAEFHLSAGAGEFDKVTGQAKLAEGVVMSSGALKIELQDVVWDNTQRQARSDNPVVITMGATRLQAAIFCFTPEGQLLDISGVEGVVDLAGMEAVGAGKAADAASETPPEPDKKPEPEPEQKTPALSPEEAQKAFANAKFSRMVLSKAPELRMAAMRLEYIRGGVSIQLASEESGVEPVSIEAKDVAFDYAQNAGASMPALVRLDGGVKVNGPTGAIESAKAELDLQAKRFRFEGGVSGASPGVESFRASNLTYQPGRVALDGGVDLKSGEMAVQASAVALDGEKDVLSATGKVRIDSPQGLVLAGEAERDGKQRAMTFKGGVSLDGPEGKVSAGSALIDDASGTMTFTGNVQGSMGEIKDFRASRIVRNTKTGDADITDLTVREMALGSGDPAQSPGGMSFNKISIEKAPKVSVKSGSVERIMGGVDFSLQSAKPGEAPMHVLADQAEFLYTTQGGKMPDKVVLTGNVLVDGPMGSIHSKKGELETASKRFVFSGNVAGSAGPVGDFKADTLTYDTAQAVLDGHVDVAHPDGHIRADKGVLNTTTGDLEFSGNLKADTPQAQGVSASRLVYNQKTKAFTLYESQTQTVQLERKKPLDSPELRTADVRDWPGWLAKMRGQAAQDAPSPGKRLMSLLPPDFAAALGRLSAGKTPNGSVQGEITKAVNAILAQRDFYDAPSWQGMGLEPEAQELLAKDRASLSSKDILRLNRLLLEAAYPAELTRASQRPPEAGAEEHG